MPPTIKCRQCGNIVPKTDAIEMKPRCYVCCEKCKADYIDEHTEKPKPVKEPPKPTSPSPMRQLTDYVQTYAPNTDWIRFVAQVKSMIKEYNMTIGGIQYTLWYMREHQDVAVRNDGLSLVPFWYNEAKKYHAWLNQVRQNIKQWQIDDRVDVIVKKNEEKDVFG